MYHAMKISLKSLDNVLPNLHSTCRTFRCKTKVTDLTLNCVSGKTMLLLCKVITYSQSTSIAD